MLGVQTPIAPGSKLSLSGMSLQGSAYQPGFVGRIYLEFEVEESHQPSGDRESILPGRQFRYYRTGGDVVTVLGIALEAADPPDLEGILNDLQPESRGTQEIVVYRTEKGSLRFRPKSEFLELVTHMGQTVPRYTPVHPFHWEKHHHE